MSKSPSPKKSVVSKRATLMSAAKSQVSRVGISPAKASVVSKRSVAGRRSVKQPMLTKSPSPAKSPVKSVKSVSQKKILAKRAPKASA